MPLLQRHTARVQCHVLVGEYTDRRTMGGPGLSLKLDLDLSVIWNRSLGLQSHLAHS